MCKQNDGKEVYVIEEIKFEYTPPEKCTVGGSMMMTVSFVDHITIRHGASCGSRPDIGQVRCIDYLMHIMEHKPLVMHEGELKAWVVPRKASGNTAPDQEVA